MEHRGPVDLGIPGLGPADVIGEGGNAFVYRSRQESLDRDVAVKVLKHASDEGTQRRFGREQRAMGRMSQHDGMVTVYESGISGAGEPYLVMPMLPGSLQDDIEAQGRLPWAEAVDVIANVATTVHFAHQDGLIHRDLKPANLMRSSTGRPLVADFGISHIIDAGVSMKSAVLTLTPAFSPPEALAGQDAGPATDVYSLGATLYAMIEGHPPFVDAVTSSNLLALVKRIDDEPVPRLTTDAPDWINAVLAAAMAKNPNDRIPSADALARLLRSGGRGLEAGPGVRAEHPSGSDTASTIVSEANAQRESAQPGAASPDGSQRQRRSWLKLGVAASALIVGLVAATIVITSGGDGEEGERAAESENSLAVPEADSASTGETVAQAAPIVEVPASGVETLVLQAEDQVLVAPMAAQTDPTADGSAFVSTTEPNAGVMRFDFEVSQPGLYSIWVRVVSPQPQSNSDSFAVRLDDEQVDVWDFFEDDAELRSGWNWDRISLRCGGSFDVHLCDPLRVNLDTGRTHSLALLGREAFSGIDVLVVTNDPDFDPMAT